MKYECECIVNMEWVKSYEHCVHSKQTTALILLFHIIVDLAVETMKHMTYNSQTVNYYDENNNNQSYMHAF